MIINPIFAWKNYVAYETWNGPEKFVTYILLPVTPRLFIRLNTNNLPVASYM